MIGEIGLGTYNLKGKLCTNIVQQALDLGYRLFDTASAYENHKEIGHAIANFDRRQIKLVSKIWIEQEVDDQDIPGSIAHACERTLKELSTDYLDIYLIHWPNHLRPMNQMLEAMLQLKQLGKVREVGVSNFTEHHLQDLYDAGIAVSWNQIEVHPLLSQKKLIEFARSHETNIMAYRPFGKGKLIDATPLFGEIGNNHGKSPAQVILRWLVQQGLTVIPKASTPQHLSENFEVFDFSLSESEMSALNQLNCELRTCEKEFSEFNY